LAACPFCGGEAKWLDEPVVWDEPFGLVVSHAQDCFLGPRMMAEWGNIITAWNQRADPLHTSALAAGYASVPDWVAAMVGENERLREALGLALDMLEPFEPGDSRAVSNEFVAMAAIHAGLTDRVGECITIIRTASAALTKGQPDV